jgi:hypothetical protein
VERPYQKHMFSGQLYLPGRFDATQITSRELNR